MLKLGRLYWVGLGILLSSPQTDHGDDIQRVGHAGLRKPTNTICRLSRRVGKVIDFATFDSFMSTILLVFPTAIVDKDEDGQIVINTGLWEANCGCLVTEPEIENCDDH